MGLTTFAPIDPAGVSSITATTAAVGITMPAIQFVGAATASGVPKPQPNYAIIFAESASCRWRDDGTDPTGAVGMPLPFGQYFYYDGRLDRIKFATATGGNVIVNVALYRGAS